MLPDLIAQQLHGEAGLVPVDHGAVHQQTCRFVDRHQPWIPVDNLQWLISFGYSVLSIHRPQA